MKTVSIRDLRYDFKAVERILREGDEIQITKRRQVIARLIPEPKISATLPDFLGRLQNTFGVEPLPISGAEIVGMDRTDR